jgi:hypothetical protein
VNPVVAHNTGVHVTTDTVRSRTEARLRSAGIRHIRHSRTDFCDPQRAILEVSVYFHGNAFSVNVDFLRQVAWSVDTSADDIRGGAAPTRQDVAIGTHDGRDVPVMEALDAMLDQFLKAYLKANQTSVL